MTQWDSNQICLISIICAFFTSRNKARPIKIDRVLSSKQQNQTWQTWQIRNLLKDSWAFHRNSERAGEPQWNFPDGQCFIHQRARPVRKQSLQRQQWSLDAKEDLTAAGVLRTQVCSHHWYSQEHSPQPLPLCRAMLPITQVLFYTLLSLMHFVHILAFIPHKGSMKGTLSLSSVSRQRTEVQIS